MLFSPVNYFRTIFITCILYSVSEALTNVKIKIPKAIKRGENALMECHYDLEGEQLYSVKWYKGGREFYRYTPRENPPIKQFPIPGLNVLQSASNGTYVCLKNVSIENSGQYSCEMTADAPSFYTRMEAGILEIVIIPKHDPQISGLKSRYRLGDVLKAECVSKESRPAANLTWLVNGEPAESARIRRHHSRTSDNTLVNAHSLLRIQITEPLFSKGRLKIRCVASLYNVYYRSSEKSVDLEKQKHKQQNIMINTTTFPPPDKWDAQQPGADRFPQSTLFFIPGSSSKQMITSFLLLTTILALILR